MNPLQDLMMQLSAQSGPRGAIFAGRRIPQGQAPDLKALMTQRPLDISEEGFGMLPSMNPAALMSASAGTGGGNLADSLRRYVGWNTELMKAFEEERKRRLENAR